MKENKLKPKNFNSALSLNSKNYVTALRRAESTTIFVLGFWVPRTAD